jgi:hypothetical protein
MNVENEDLSFDVQVFPNPSDGQISFFHQSLVEVSLSTIDGKEVANILANQGHIYVDQHLTPGVYFAHCRLANNQTVTRKVVIH